MCKVGVYIPTACSMHPSSPINHFQVYPSSPAHIDPSLASGGYLVTSFGRPAQLLYVAKKKCNRRVSLYQYVHVQWVTFIKIGCLNENFMTQPLTHGHISVPQCGDMPILSIFLHTE
jgi:hypothetical protein